MLDLLDGFLESKDTVEGSLFSVFCFCFLAAFCTDKFATTCVLSMPKPLTFETTQGIWDERYTKVTSFDGWRKDGYIKGQDKGICR